MSLLNIEHRQQRRESDCLVACADMVLNYLGVSVRYSRLTRLLQAQSFGAPFRNIEYLEKLGLSVTTGYGSPQALDRWLIQGLPLIANVDTFAWQHWAGEATDHAVVVSGFEANETVADASSVFIHDPFFASSPHQLSLLEFETGWSEKDYQYAVLSLT